MASGPDENGRERIVQASKPADESEILAGDKALEGRAEKVDSQTDEYTGR